MEFRRNPVVALQNTWSTPTLTRNWLLMLGQLGRRMIGTEGSARESIGSPSASIDPAFKRVAMYLFVGTKGGYNRMKIITLLQGEPMNANKICEKVQLDYKTVQHHLRILEDNKMIVTSSPKGTYGAMYFLASYVERNVGFLNDIWARFGKR